MIKNLIICCGFFLICSCTTGSITFQNLYTSIKPLVNPDRSIPQRYDDSFPYSYASVRVGRGQIIYVVLSQVDGSTLRWISSDGFEIKTINGKVVSSDGFDKNLVYKEINKDLELNNKNLEERIITVYSNDHDPFETRISLYRVTKDSLIEERFHSSEIKWSGKNKFYLDDNGKVVRSINYVNPLMPKVEMQFYKLHASQ